MLSQTPCSQKSKVPTFRRPPNHGDAGAAEFPRNPSGAKVGRKVAAMWDPRERNKTTKVARGAPAGKAVLRRVPSGLPATNPAHRLPSPLLRGSTGVRPGPAALVAIASDSGLPRRTRQGVRLLIGDEPGCPCNWRRRGHPAAPPALPSCAASSDSSRLTLWVSACDCTVVHLEGRESWGRARLEYLTLDQEWRPLCKSTMSCVSIQRRVRRKRHCRMPPS